MITTQNADNIVKCAIHAKGYIHPQASTSDTSCKVSTPRTKSYGGSHADNVPKEAITALRSGLSAWFPSLAEKDFESTRLCWSVLVVKAV